MKSVIYWPSTSLNLENRWRVTQLITTPFMAFTESLTLSPLDWCIWLIIAIITTIITSTVTQLECKKRRWKLTSFASDRLKNTSAISFICGLITPVLWCLDLMPGFCYLQWTVAPVFGQAQFLFMGLYQLSRLHYSFSKNRAHHQNGYPKWIFIVMVTVGFILLMSLAVLVTLGQSLPSKCGFTSGFTLEWEYKDSPIMFEGDVDQVGNRNALYSESVWFCCFPNWNIQHISTSNRISYGIITSNPIIRSSFCSNYGILPLCCCIAIKSNHSGK